MQLLDPFFCLRAVTANNGGDTHRLSCLARLSMVKIGLSGEKNSTPKKPKGP